MAEGRNASDEVETSQSTSSQGSYSSDPVELELLQTITMMIVGGGHPLCISHGSRSMTFFPAAQCMK